MSWKVRHAGSPDYARADTAEDIAQGVLDGVWEPTDEVKGPADSEWVALENHPTFAEALADYDPLPAAAPPEETRLDMNPLIDVALVLLIFFILTTTYEELRKEFPPPPAGVEESKTQGMRDSDLRKRTIRVTAAMEDGEPVVRVENRPVGEEGLQAAIEKAVKETGYDKLAVEIQPAVPWRTFMAIQDAAAGAKITETYRIERLPRAEAGEK